MEKIRKLRQALLAGSVASAVLLPTFGYGQSAPGAAVVAKSAPSTSQAGVESSEHGQRDRGGKSASRRKDDVAPSEFFTQADRDLVKRVQEDLSADPSLTTPARQLDITARQGTVTVQGTVMDEQARAAIAAEVQRTMGVEMVENQLHVAGGLSSSATSESSSAAASRPDGGGMGSSSRTSSH